MTTTAENNNALPPALQRGLTLEEKLALLSAAARYDASCSSSGSTRQGEVGAAYKSGI